MNIWGGGRGGVGIEELPVHFGRHYTQFTGTENLLLFFSDVICNTLQCVTLQPRLCNVFYVLCLPGSSCSNF